MQSQELNKYLALVFSLFLWTNVLLSTSQERVMTGVSQSMKELGDFVHSVEKTMIFPAEAPFG